MSTEKMNLERVRSLAQRWAAEQTRPGILVPGGEAEQTEFHRLADCGVMAYEGDGHWRVRTLDDCERDVLLGWARRYMDREYDTAECMVEDSGGSVEGALAHLTEGELGIENIDAWRLCKAAGWPS